jgi:hypothetical protein
LFGGFSPPNKKVISLRPPSFCGKISIIGAYLDFQKDGPIPQSRPKGSNHLSC